MKINRYEGLERMFVIVMIIFVLGIGTAAGETSEDDTYIIRDVFELQAINDDIKGNYILANDIDASVTRDWNQGEGFLPIGLDDPFTGEFDGNGHVVKGLYISRGNVSNAALFGSVGEGGTIRDIGLVNSVVVGGNNVGGLIGFNGGSHVSNSYFSGEVMGRDNVGGLIGYNYRGDVYHSFSTGEVKGNGTVGGMIGLNTGTTHRTYFSGEVIGDGNRVGGLMGFNSGMISESYTSVAVKGRTYVGGFVGYNCFALISGSYSTGFVNGSSTVGGLMGWNDGNVQNSYSLADVNGDRNVGGLVGVNAIGVLENSYAAGKVNGGENIGGLLGLNRDDGIVDSCFWDVDVSGQSVSDGGIGLTTGKMMESDTYIDAGWDLEDTWTLIEDETYPFLNWKDETEAELRRDFPYIWLSIIIVLVVVLASIFLKTSRDH